MSDERPDGDPAPDERRLAEHLQMLRRAAPDRRRSLVPRIARTARWQRIVREPVRVAGMIAGAAVDALRSLVTPGRSRG